MRDFRSFGHVEVESQSDLDELPDGALIHAMDADDRESLERLVSFPMVKVDGRWLFVIGNQPVTPSPTLALVVFNPNVKTEDAA